MRTSFIAAELKHSWQLGTESFSQSSSWRTKLPLLLSVELAGCHICSAVAMEGVLAMVLLPRCSTVTLQARSKHFLGALVDGNQSPHFQHSLGFDASDWLFCFER